MSKKYSVFHAINFRKDYFKTKLQLLGYLKETDLQEPLDSSKLYNALRRVGSALESYINPARAIFNNEKDSDDIIEEYNKKIQNDKSFMENQDEFHDRLRSIYPDFALNMDKKVSPEDWEFYEKITKQTAELLRDLTVGGTKRDLTLVPEIEEQDAISEFIDSRDFAKACKIEDTFMMQEYEEFERYAEMKGYNEPNVKNTAPCVAIAKLVKTSQILGDKKRQYISNYEKYEKFLEGLTDKVTIQSKIPHKKEGVDRDEY